MSVAQRMHASNVAHPVRLNGADFLLPVLCLAQCDETIDLYGVAVSPGTVLGRPVELAAILKDPTGGSCASDVPYDGIRRVGRPVPAERGIGVEEEELIQI